MPDHLIVDCPELQKDKSKRGSYHKDIFRNKVKKSLMATWDKLDKEEESDEEEANLAMMALTSSDTKSNSDPDSDCEEDEVFSKLSHSNLITLIQDLMGHFQDKARDIKILKKSK